MSATDGIPIPPTVPKRRRWDAILTVILLVLGLFGAASGILAGAALPEVIDELHRRAGLGGIVDDGSLRGPGMVLWVSHLVLYVVAAGLGAVLLARRRIAFWIPLTAGVIAAIVYWVTLAIVLSRYPGLLGSFAPAG